MTDIKEKIKIGSAKNFWETEGSKDLEIKQLSFNDGPHGVRATRSSDIIVTDNKDARKKYARHFCKIYFRQKNRTKGAI